MSPKLMTMGGGGIGLPCALYSSLLYGQSYCRSLAGLFSFTKPSPALSIMHEINIFHSWEVHFSPIEGFLGSRGRTYRVAPKPYKNAVARIFHVSNSICVGGGRGGGQHTIQEWQWRIENLNRCQDIKYPHTHTPTHTPTLGTRVKCGGGGGGYFSL